MPQPPQNLKDIQSLVQIISDLRGPDGCPWDKAQSHQTLAPYAIEEVHELVEALESADSLHICEELGDVLFQVVLHAQLAAEKNQFNFSDVICGIASKIVRRHPHVFAGQKVTGIDEIFKNWDEIKKLEKQNQPKKTKTIDVPESLPALQRAFAIGEKTNKLNFDWKEISGVIQQLKAEITELEMAIEEPPSAQKTDHLRHELGDVLFSAAQVARHLQHEPESCLREGNRRFLKRFEMMLSLKKITAEEFKKLAASEKENLWSAAKKEC